MSILATIRNHSGRLYRGIQLLLMLSLCSATFAAIGNSESGWSNAGLVVSIAATALSLMTLMYMRRSVVHRLRLAAEVEAENQKLLRTDAVTGAATRRFFLEELQASLGGLHSRKKAALVLVDIDHFKQLNDTLGHQFGDAALAHLVSAARQAYPDCTIGRLGGDEFGVIVPDGNLTSVMAQTQGLLDALRAGKVHEGNKVALSASVGIAVAPLHSSETKELMLLADLALYDSKAAGRGRMTVFDAEMLSDKRYRRLVERACAPRFI